MSLMSDPELPAPASVTGPPAASTYRSFLFADLRGYTAYLERAGNAAGVELLDEYLSIARAAVAQHDGAVVKVEGDGFHAVFPSASSAVLCGLAIVGAAAEASAARPERPIRVGVGVHAGEAVETPQGWIGSAVNLAARVCAAARPGEVLVTSTVRAITQASIPVGFVARGRRRLKGIREPVEVFAADPDRTVRTVRHRSRWAVVGASAAIVLAIALAGGLAIALLGQPPPQASPSPSGQPIALGTLAIGRYSAPGFEQPLSFTVADGGWTAYRDLPAAVGLMREVDPRGRLDVLLVDEVFADPCVEGGEGHDSVPAQADLTTILAMLPYVELDEPRPVTIGGRSAQSVNVTVSEGALAACGGFGTGDVTIFRAGDERWRAQAGERFRVISVAGAGRPLAILLSVDWTTTRSVAEQEAFLALAERVVNSIEL
jgi:class 3 adenylate cyclase